MQAIYLMVEGIFSSIILIRFSFKLILSVAITWKLFYESRPRDN